MKRLHKKLIETTLLALGHTLFTACGGGSGGEGTPTPDTTSTWEGMLTVDIGGENAFNPKISMDTSGNTLAVWKQSDGGRQAIWSNNHSMLSGWGTAEKIEIEDFGSSENPQIAMDSTGNAFAVWQQHDGTHTNIWANRYTEVSGWGVAQKIELEDFRRAYNPQVAVDSAGNALAVWELQFNDRRSDIWSNRYTVGSGWGTAQKIEFEDVGSSDNPRIDMDSAGNALVVWEQYDVPTTDYKIWANRYTLRGGWGLSQTIQTVGSRNASNVQIAMDPLGNGFAIWTHSNTSGSNIWVNRYTAGSGWGAVEKMQGVDITGGVGSPQIVMDASGNAFAAWPQYNGRVDDIWAKHYAIGTGWGAAQKIDTEDLGDARFPQLALDPLGNAFAVWYQHDGSRYNIWANYYTAGRNWGIAEKLETENFGDATNPQIAMDDLGNALAVWYQYDGTRSNIQSNTFMK